MGRRSHADNAPPLDEVWIALLCGPMRGHEWETEVMAEMEAGWAAHRDKIMEEYGDRPSRPWGWWVFEAKEPMPDRDDEAARLAELNADDSDAL